MDFTECACSGKSLARLLRPAVLAVLARGAVHGYRVAQELQRLAMFAGTERDGPSRTLPFGEPPDNAGLYRALGQMVDEGLLLAEWDLADSGPARRVFTITPRGRACLKQWACTLRSYRQAVDELLDLLASSPAGGAGRP